MIAETEYTSFEELADALDFSSLAKELCIRIINGEQFNFTEPYLNLPNLYPNESIPDHIDDFDDIKSNGISILSELCKLDVVIDQAVSIVQIFLCDELDYYISADGVFELFPAILGDYEKMRTGNWEDEFEEYNEEEHQIPEKPLTFTHRYHDPDNHEPCPICYDDPSDIVFRCPECRHEFCEACITEWFNTKVSFDIGTPDEHILLTYEFHDTCPNCQSKLRDRNDL
jgi:hypothetical protein